jgi:hypothetical protein
MCALVAGRRSPVLRRRREAEVAHQRQQPVAHVRLGQRAEQVPGGNAWFGAWWLDPAVGLLIAAVAVREGLQAWRGEGCCVSAPPGLVALDEGCRDACCTTGQAPKDDCCSH